MQINHFNKVNYSLSKDRRFLLANVNYFSSLEKYVLEISPVDLMPADQIKKLHQIVRDVTYFGDELYFLLNSSRLQNEKIECIKKYLV